MKDRNEPALAALAIVGRREILDWRDRHLQNAALTLARTWQDLRPEIDERLDAISWGSALTEANAFIAREIDPVLGQAFHLAAERIIRDAQRELNAIVEHQLEVETTIAGTPASAEALAEVADIVAGLVPLAGGVVLGAALPGLAVVSGTAFLGLVATSAVSTPVLVGGLLLAGAAFATGAVKTSQIRDVRNARMRARVKKHIERAVLSSDSAEGAPSVMCRLTTAIDTAAQAALERLND